MPVFRLLVTVFVLLSFSACTTLQPLRDTRPVTVQQAVQIGDEVHLTTRSGAAYDIKVTRIGPTFIAGYDRDLYVKAPFVDITAIGVRKFSAGRTAAVAGGIGGGVVVVVYTVLVVTAAVGFYRLFRDLADD